MCFNIVSKRKQGYSPDNFDFVGRITFSYLEADTFPCRAAGAGQGGRSSLFAGRDYWCWGRNKSCTTFTGEKVDTGTSTKTVFHLAMAPFHRPGSS